MDSRWILDKELAGLTPIKKRSKVHLESTWNLWLRVKSSMVMGPHCHWWVVVGPHHCSCCCLVMACCHHCMVPLSVCAVVVVIITCHHHLSLLLSVAIFVVLCQVCIASSLHCVIIVHHGCCCVVVCWLVTLGGMGWEYSPFLALKIANSEQQFHHCSSFDCHITVSNMAPGCRVKMRKGDRD